MAADDPVIPPTTAMLEARIRDLETALQLAREDREEIKKELKTLREEKAARNDDGDVF